MSRSDTSSRVDLQQPLTSPLLTLKDLWTHVVENILELNNEDLKLLNKGRLSSMLLIFMYMMNLDKFDNRFQDDTPMIMMTRYFIMHCYVNDYEFNRAPLMQQTSKTFVTIDTMGLKTD